MANSFSEKRKPYFVEILHKRNIKISKILKIRKQCKILDPSV